MTGYEEIVYLISNLFRVYVIARFFRAFLGREALSMKKEILLYGLFYVINSVCYLMADIPLLNITLNFIGLNLLAFIYQDTFRKKSLTVLMVMAVNMVCEGLFAAVFTAYKTDMPDNAMVIVLSVLSFFALEFLIERKADINKSFQLKRQHWLTLILIPVGSIVIIALIFINDAGNKIAVIFNVLIIFVLNMVTFYLYESILRSYSRDWERRLLEEQIEMYEKQFTVQKQSQEKIRAVKHDMKSHIVKIYDMAQKSNASGILAYLKDIEEFTANPKEYVNSGNERLDRILNYMIEKLIGLGTDVKFKIQVPKELKLSFFDLNVILGNLLQNALDAILGNCKEKRIYIEITYSKGTMFIFVQNTFDGKILSNSQGIITRKKNKESHGIGLKNVKRIVDKYNGECRISIKENVFSVYILLYLQDD